MVDRVPSHQTLRVPVFQALQELGGEATQAEIVRKVATNEELSDSAINMLHKQKPSRKPKTELEYRIEWARSYLNKYGIAVIPKRGTSKLSDEYLHASIDSVKEKIKENR